MLRLNYQLPGTPPATLLLREDCHNKPPVMTLFRYDETELLEIQVDSVADIDRHFDPAKINWINICGLGDLELLKQLGERFKIHPLALEDVLNTTQRPKLEEYEDYLFIVSEMVYFDGEHRLTSEQLSLFLGANFVLTFQEESGADIFETIRGRLRSGKGYSRKMKSDYLAYALLDAAVDQLFPVLEAVGDQLDESEEELLDKPNKEAMRNIFKVQRMLLQLRRVAWPHREIFNGMLRDESGLIRPETHHFLRDCYDHSTQIIDMIETYRDLAAGLMDVNFASLDAKTNEIMRVLTLVSTFFLPLSFLAGVYGMNFNTDSHFNMPELDWKFGYLYFWGLALAVAGGMFVFFRRKKWI